MHIVMIRCASSAVEINEGLSIRRLRLLARLRTDFL